MSRWAAILGFFLAVMLGQLKIHATAAVTAQTLLPARSLAQSEDDRLETINTLSARTERIDPLTNFKKYEGGYNITDKHYWSSVIFTGRYGYGIGVAWLLCGVCLLLVLLSRSICFGKKGKRESKRSIPCSKRCRFWPILLGISITFLALILSGLILGSSRNFHSRASNIKNIVIETVQQASSTIHDVTGALKSMQEDRDLFAELAVSSSLNTTSQKLNDDADNIQRKAEKNMHLVDKGLKILKVITITTISLNLVLILALLAIRTVKFHRVFYMLIVLSWLFTFFFWQYYGLYFFLNKFSGDTCMALNEYRQDPQNSSLGSILPCTDQVFAKSILRDTGAGMHDIIDQVNANISKAQPFISGLSYVCNPFSGPPEYNYQPENCSTNTIQIGEIPQVLKRYACSGGDDGTCKPGEFISASDYSKVIVYSDSIQNLLDAYPGLEKLVDCQIVKDAFSKVLFEQCKPLKKYARITWASMLVLAIIMVFLVLIRTLEAFHDALHHPNDGSVQPHLTPTESPAVDLTLEP